MWFMSYSRKWRGESGKEKKSHATTAHANITLMEDATPA